MLARQLELETVARKVVEQLIEHTEAEGCALLVEADGKLRVAASVGLSDPAALEEIFRKIDAVREDIRLNPFEFDRRFLLQVLSMGHAQLAEYIGARGPCTQVNAACASTPHWPHFRAVLPPFCRRAQPR